MFLKFEVSNPLIASIDILWDFFLIEVVRTQGVYKIIW